MKTACAVLSAFALLVLTPAASAEVTNGTETGFLLTYQEHVTASPAEAQRKFGEIGHWWSSAHTYSGNAANMTLDLQAGGCFCERWADNSVEHMRVVAVMEQQGTRTVRLEGALGPLQELGVTGIMTVTLAAEGSGTNIAVTYRVVGAPGLGLDEMAVPVNGVLLEQFRRFASYTNS